MWLEVVKRFPRPVKIHELKRNDPDLAQVKAFKQGLVSTLYPTTPEEAQVLLRTCGVRDLTEQTEPVGNARFGEPEQNEKVERAAVQVASECCEDEGWTVRSVEQDRVGYDLLASKGDKERHIEVKGVSGGEPEFFITARELSCAREDDPLWELCVVTEALTLNPGLHWWTGKEVDSAFLFEPTAYRAVLRP